jgi:hypothetical protein
MSGSKDILFISIVSLKEAKKILPSIPYVRLSYPRSTLLLLATHGEHEYIP